MMEAPLSQGRLRVRRRDGATVWQLQCPQCGHWGDIDDDQLHGRISTDHTNCGALYDDSYCDCSFHETRDWRATAEMVA